MSRFIDSSDVKVIQAEWWDEGETVTIKRFSYGDRQRLAGLATRAGTKLETGDAIITDVYVGRMNLAILEVGIVEWTLQDEGKVVKLNRQAIERLTDEDGDFILGEIQAFNPRRRRSAEEQEFFRGGAGAGAAE